jgi:hypothetical protein
MLLHEDAVMQCEDSYCICVSVSSFQRKLVIQKSVPNIYSTFLILKKQKPDFKVILLFVYVHSCLPEQLLNA